ncbi:hypothetical protein GCM10011512_17080 [Tersicoccus solisilvae]|uniref:DUF72 domain-containing protein n=1 Tax=Tersicoccus solisilvae TaxID=1882339 RepID=A0ABQ1P3X3_9MICC|nr:DUF72 domain-containing protein [Tersicoccus solisilvae]GGC90648.1 hypothetical protein GCM10011512_17080 [Tersicoccus solisilvae]
MTTGEVTSTGTARVGISGWRYAPWRGSFYPTGLPQRRELAFASSHLRTIEINGSFYSLQRPSSYRQWYVDTPEDFVFSVKGGRYITHLLRLRNVHTALANFFASGVLALADKLGPVLWQLPERVEYDAELLERFLAQLPHTTGAAARLAAEHDEKLPEDRTWTDIAADRPLRHALEIRHVSYDTPAFVEQLRRHEVALVVADTAGRWPDLRHVTADFVYVRLHGAEELYTSGYTGAELDRWAATVDRWRTGRGCPDGVGRDVFVYFDNDVKVRAPVDAMGLARRLGAGPGPAVATDDE